MYEDCPDGPYVATILNPKQLKLVEKLHLVLTLRVHQGKEQWRINTPERPVIKDDQSIIANCALGSPSNTFYKWFDNPDKAIKIATALLLYHTMTAHKAHEKCYEDLRKTIEECEK